jgi:mono/diheme cytochrome c family protein
MTVSAVIVLGGLLLVGAASIGARPQATGQASPAKTTPTRVAATPATPARQAPARPSTRATTVSQTTPAAAPMAGPRAVLDQYCVTCHNTRLKTAGLALDTLDLARVGDHADVWETVARKLRTHEMPPPGMPRPGDATFSGVTSWLETALDATAEATPNPGRVMVHRLNRTEYANAVRDLLGLEVDARSLLVADEPDQQSFDNIASVLSVSPALLENYLSAAYKVSRLAVADRSMTPIVETYTIPMGLVQDDRTSQDLPFGSQGGTSIRHHFPLDGEYTLKITLRRQLYLYIIGIGEPHQLDVRLDGVRVGKFTVGGEGKGRTAPEGFAGNTQGDPEWEVYMHVADAGLELRVPVTAGTHEVGVSFARRFWEPEGIRQPPQRGFARTTNELYHGSPAVDSVAIGGPYAVAPRRGGAEGPRTSGQEAGQEAPSRRRVFVCRPVDRAREEPCARQIFSTLATRAYRRPTTPADVDTLLEFYRAGRAEGDFDTGIQRGLERMLAAPSFLFRIVREPVGLAPGTPYRLSDLDLASRLSFFLWSSIPDDALLNAAIRGTLKEPATLNRHVRRLLADPRASALVDNFAVQWLKLGKIAGVVPDVNAFPDFDENLREAMLQETRLFIGSQVRDDRSVMELLTANYSFLNERLARHYQVKHVYGSHFRRVTFDNGVRGGLLGQASIMTVTSYPNRTSPVLRGKWLLDTMLGSPPPAPPPDVPSLNESAGDRPRTLREQMEAHRTSPTCAVCHVRMDPLGFSLENFDALGQFRTVSDGQPVDVTATLPDGSQFTGVAGLRALLVSHREEFVRTFSEKLLAYAVGRGTEASDLPAVRRIVREAADRGAGEQDYRWSSLIAAIVRSAPFSMSTVRPVTPDASVAENGAATGGAFARVTHAGEGDEDRKVMTMGRLPR